MFSGEIYLGKMLGPQRPLIVEAYDRQHPALAEHLIQHEPGEHEGGEHDLLSVAGQPEPPRLPQAPHEVCLPDLAVPLPVHGVQGALHALLLPLQLGRQEQAEHNPHLVQRNSSVRILGKKYQDIRSLITRIFDTFMNRLQMCIYLYGGFTWVIFILFIVSLSDLCINICIKLS